MEKRAYPWWLGYLQASLLRSLLICNPKTLLEPYIQDGMTVLEPGPGKGFFTVPLAKMVGPLGRVVAIETELIMLEETRRRVEAVKLMSRVDSRLVEQDSMEIDDLKGAVDFALAFAVVSEADSAANFFAQAYAALKPGALLLLAEPEALVDYDEFESELKAAQNAGFEKDSAPEVKLCHAVLLKKR
jgi:predicted methyltransferase